MPTSVLVAVAAYGAEAIALELGVSALTATVIGATAGAVVGSALAERQERKAADAARAQAIANLKDVQSVIRSTVAPQNTIYGRAMVGGVVTCWFTTGDVGQYHHWAQVLAAHPIDGVDEYWIGDTKVDVDANGWVTTAKFCKSDGTQLVRIRLYDGTQTVLDADLVTASDGAFTAADAGQGKAYLYVRFEADYDVFGQIGAPVVKSVVRGKKLYDPRTGLTAFSDNAALAVRDYLTGYYGLRCTAGEINDADFIAAANVCDETVPLVSGSQKRYTANGVLSAANNLKTNLETLVDAMSGLAVWSQGQWRVKAGAYEAPTASIGVDDVLSVDDLIAYTPRRELFNTVTGTFIDPANLYAEKQFPLVTNATYVTQDGSQTIERQLAFPMCNDAVRAQRMAKIEIERARQAVTVSMLCKWTTYDLTPGDHVSVTIPRYGWAGKVFFVAKRELSPDGIRYTLRETAAAVWAWNYGNATVVDPAPNTALPNPYAVPAVTGLAAESGTNVLLLNGDGTVMTRALVSWTLVQAQNVQNGGRIEVQYKLASATTWVSQRADGDAVDVYLSNLKDGQSYNIRARCINSMGQRGAWASITHTVLGKTVPPINVTGLTTLVREKRLYLSWMTNTTDVDLAGYEVRTSNSGWGTAGFAYFGRDTLAAVPPPAAGFATTWYVKAKDTSGNYSTTAVSVSYTTPAVPMPATLTYSFSALSMTSMSVVLDWSDVAPVFGLQDYKVSWPGGSKRVNASTLTLPADWTGSRVFTVEAVDLLGNYSAGQSVTVGLSLPTAPASGTTTPTNGALVLKWALAVAGGLPVWGYEVRTDTSFGNATGMLFKGAANTFKVDDADLVLGANNFYIKAIDSAGNPSSGYLTLAYTVAAPGNVASITETFADTSLTNATITLDWPDAAPPFGLASYLVSYGAVSKTVKASTITLPADWLGSRSFTVKVVDLLGNASSGFSKSVTKLAPAAVSGLRAQVIDNNVLLYWTLPAQTTLPVSHVLIKKGATWAAASTIGTKSGAFTTLQELSGGLFTYWVAAVDTDGNESTAVSVQAQVSQPPDFRFNASWDSAFGATKSSAILDAGGVVLPVNTTETWAAHFTTPGWAGPSAQMSAGYPVFIQPGVSSGYYEEVFDYGTTLGSSQITVSLGGVAVAGTPVIDVTTSVSVDGVAYTTYAGMASLFVTNFRYVKVRVTVTQGTAGSIYKITGLNVRLDAKQKTDAGRVTAVSTDASGTIVNFGVELVDVQSITLTPLATAARLAVYDFKDAVITGTYSVTSNVATINATAHGLLAGQRVRLYFTSGTASPSGVYTVASVTSANAYTVAITTANTSGNVTTYANSMRVYLFDTAGVRQNGDVSWAVRGY